MLPVQRGAVVEMQASRRANFQQGVQRITGRSGQVAPPYRSYQMLSGPKHGVYGARPLDFRPARSQRHFVLSTN